LFFTLNKESNIQIWVVLEDKQI